MPPEDLFAILNALILTYGTARWQLLEACGIVDLGGAAGHVIQNSNSRAPTGHVSLGLLTASVVSFYGLFGRIATSEYVVVFGRGRQPQ